MDRLLLRGMTFYCHHGVHAAERELGQKLVIDLSLDLDLGRAGETDDVRETVNYSKVYGLVKSLATTEEMQLMESLAHRIASAVLARFKRVLGVEVRIAKPSPPVDGLMDSAQVVITRTRT